MSSSSTKDTLCCPELVLGNIIVAAIYGCVMQNVNVEWCERKTVRYDDHFTLSEFDCCERFWPSRGKSLLRRTLEEDCDRQPPC